MKKRSHRLPPEWIAVLAFTFFLTNCSFPSRPRIVWENFDFGDGLGNPFALSVRRNTTLLGEFIGTPIEGGVSVRDFAVKQGAGSKILWALGGLAMARSDDGGQTWQILENSMRHGAGNIGNAFLAEVDASGDLWVTTRGDVWKSSDSGSSFECISPGPPGFQCVGYNDIEIGSMAVWLPSDAGILTKITLSSGQSSTAYHGGDPQYAVLCPDTNTVYLSTESEILVSHNGGLTFSHFSDLQGARDLTLVDGKIFCTSGGDVVHIGADGMVIWRSDPGFGALCAYEGRVYALGGDRLLEVDTRSSYQEREFVFGGSSGGGDVFVDQDGMLYVGMCGRILTSMDAGDSWEEQPFGLSTVNVIGTGAGRTWAGLEGSGAAVFEETTSSWHTVGSHLQRGLCYRITAVDLRSPSRVILFGHPEPEIAISDDGGETFRFVWFGPDDNSSYEAQSVVRDGDGNLLLLLSCRVSGGTAFDLRLYRSSDDGETWSHQASFCSNPVGGPRGTLVLDEYHGCLWVAACPYAVEDGCLFCGSIDGTNWSAVDADSLYSISDASMDQSGNLYLAGGGGSGIGIYVRAADDSWSFIPKPYAEEVYPSSIVVDRDEALWIGTENGLYYRPGEHSAWFRFTTSDGLASDIIRTVHVEGEGDSTVVWVGTALGASRGFIVE